MAEGYQFSNGKALVSFYIPLPLSMVFLIWSCWHKPINFKTGLLSLLLLLLLLVPFYSFFSDTYEHYSRDDAFRYRVMATNIAIKKTLWGSDDLVFNTDRKVYLFQPGYRYYLAAWIALFGEEKRFFQFFNMLLYFSSVVLLFACFNKKSKSDFIDRGILIFFLLSSAFVVKNILMGLTEWFVATTFILFASAYLKNKKTLSVCLLALVPFIRQNLLISSVFIALWLLIQWPQWWKWATLYVLVLLLPVYHNLYYAGEWKFLSTYVDKTGYLVLEQGTSLFTQIAKTILHKLFAYTGIYWGAENFWAIALAVICIPVGTFIYLNCVRRLKGRNRLFFLAATLSAIIPTLILGGNAYYPRFEWVNLMIALVFYCLLISKKQEPIAAVERFAAK